MDILSKSINELAGEYFSLEEDDNYTGNYVGMVIDNNDPNQWGRCKIRVHGLNDDMQAEDLPWASPEFSTPISPKGSFIVPEIGTIVYVKYDDGDFYEPLYGTSVLDLENMDFEADIKEDYPDSVVIYETTKGDYFKVNRAKGEMTLKSGSGVLYKFNQNGDITLTNANTENGDMKLRIRGNFILDNRLADSSTISQNVLTSAFGNVVTKTNGAISTESLGEIDQTTNSDFNVVAGGRVSTKARSEIRSETIEHNIFANTLNILPATNKTTTKDSSDVVSTIPQEFSMVVGDDRVLAMTVVPDPLGGPFQALPFDPLTGLPSSGKFCKGVFNPVGFEASNLKRQAEILKMKANIIAKYAKLLTMYLSNIERNYAGIDSQAQLLVAGITNNTLLLDQKAKEISDTTTSLNSQRDAELAKVDDLYSSYLTKPIFGTIITGELGENVKYQNDLQTAQTTALLDITNKTNAVDIAGAGKGIINDG